MMRLISVVTSIIKLDPHFCSKCFLSDFVVGLIILFNWSKFIPGHKMRTDSNPLFYQIWSCYYVTFCYHNDSHASKFYLRIFYKEFLIRDDYEFIIINRNWLFHT